jgi:hypothetical protein
VDVKSEDKQSAKIYFEVVDTGIGINQKNQEKLFRSFVQAESTTSRQFGGTGLGLSISKKLSTLLGGEIGVQSELGEGSSFWFTVDAGTRTRGKTLCEDNLVCLDGKRVLVVEDNKMVSSWLAKYCAVWNMQVEVHDSLNGTDRMPESSLADDVGHAGNYDFIFVNINLLNLDQLQADLAPFRRSNCNHKAKLILVTGLLFGIDKEETQAIGVHAQMQLPGSKSGASWRPPSYRLFPFILA